MMLTITLHLDSVSVTVKKGIIINREVRINVVGREYDRTDLQIEAVTVDQKGQDIHVITVIVEVKKSSNAELFTAMTTQLVERYLKGKGLTHGIYLVGWFGTDQSINGITIEEIYGALKTESDKLSAYGYKVEAIAVTAMRPLGKKEAE